MMRSEPQSAFGHVLPQTDFQRAELQLTPNASALLWNEEASCILLPSQVPYPLNGTLSKQDVDFLH